MGGASFLLTVAGSLLDATLQDFAPIYQRLDGAGDIPIDAMLDADRVFTTGTQAYAAAGGRLGSAATAAG